jgi:hypothetical protein
MDKVDIIVFSAALVVLAVRLYFKYVKKNKDRIDAREKISSVKEDDYEPYSKTR